jgi:predicted phage terminase large subunit-like protein
MVRHYQHGYFITDVKRGRWSPGEAEQKIIATAEADGKACWQSLPQDPGQAGKSQKRYLANLLSGYRVHFSPESGSKEDRARPWAAQAEAGNVHLVRGPWNEELICELTVFPNSTFKDQADAGSRAFAYLTSKRPKNPGAAPRPI